jgi:hypothetical protein
MMAAVSTPETSTSLRLHGSVSQKAVIFILTLFLIARGIKI